MDQSIRPKTVTLLASHSTHGDSFAENMLLSLSLHFIKGT